MICWLTFFEYSTSLHVMQYIHVGLGVFTLIDTEMGTDWGNGSNTSDHIVHDSAQHHVYRRGDWKQIQILCSLQDFVSTKMEWAFTSTSVIQIHLKYCQNCATIGSLQRTEIKRHDDQELVIVEHPETLGVCCYIVPGFGCLGLLLDCCGSAVSVRLPCSSWCEYIALYVTRYWIEYAGNK